MPETPKEAVVAPIDHDKVSDEKVERHDLDGLRAAALVPTRTNDPSAEPNLHQQLTHQDPYLGRGTPSKKQFMPWQALDGANVFQELWIPFYLHLFPAVEFAAFVVSWSAGVFLVVNLLQSQVFAAPPYNFSSQTVGLFNIAILVRAMIGLVTSGPLSDWVAARLTAQNGGIRESEMRLLSMIPYIVIMIFGSIIVAVGYDRSWPWEAVVIIGYACVGMQVAALPAIASTYAIDSFKPVTGSLMVTITVNKNLWGDGVG